MNEPKINCKAEVRKVSDLKLWDKNPRTITKEEFEQLKKEIVEAGFHDVVKIDTDGTIISGNQRKRALEELGVIEVIVLVPDRPLSEDERLRVANRSNTSPNETTAQ